MHNWTFQRTRLYYICVTRKFMQFILYYLRTTCTANCKNYRRAIKLSLACLRESKAALSVERKFHILNGQNARIRYDITILRRGSRMYANASRSVMFDTLCPRGESTRARATSRKCGCAFPYTYVIARVVRALHAHVYICTWMHAILSRYLRYRWSTHVRMMYEPR